MRPGPKRPRKLGLEYGGDKLPISFNEAGAEKAPETRLRPLAWPLAWRFNEAGAEKAPETMTC